MKFHFEKVVVFGVGGVGSSLLPALCRFVSGQIPIHAYDDDNFEGGAGITRFPKIHNVKMLKVDYVCDQIEAIWKDPPPIPFRRKITVEDFAGLNWKGVLVVDCSDMDPDHRAILHTAIIASGATYMRISYDGIGVANVAAGLPLLTKADASKKGGYRMPPRLGMAQGAGGWASEYVIYALMTGEIREGELKVPMVLTEEAKPKVKEVSDGVAKVGRKRVPSRKRDDRGGEDNKGNDSDDGGGGGGPEAGVGGPPVRRPRSRAAKNTGK